MAPKLALVWMLSLALLAGTSAVAPATAVAQDSATALDQAQAQYEASESSYASAGGGGVDAGGFTGQLQQLVSAGQGGQADQLVQARASARASLEAAIATYMSALELQRTAFLASGKTDQAQSIQGAMDDLRARLKALATDAQNEKLATKALAGSIGGPTSAPIATGPAAAPIAPATPALGSSTPAGAQPMALAAKDASVATGAVRAPATPAAPKPRKATGRLVFVARGDSLETTIERLDRACAILRDGARSSDETTSGEIEVYLIERWRDAQPVRIKLSKDDAHVAELVRLRKYPGATCSVEGRPEVVVKRTRSEAEVVELRDWKLLALSAVDRLGNPVSTAAARPAPAKPAPTAPGPLAAQEEENFND